MPSLSSSSLSSTRASSSLSEGADVDFSVSEGIFSLNPAMKLNCFPVYSFTSDKANLLDVSENGKAGRFVHHIMDESAVGD